MDDTELRDFADAVRAVQRGMKEITGIAHSAGGAMAAGRSYLGRWCANE